MTARHLLAVALAAAAVAGSLTVTAPLAPDPRPDLEQIAAHQAVALERSWSATSLRMSAQQAAHTAAAQHRALEAAEATLVRAAQIVTESTPVLPAQDIAELTAQQSKLDELTVRTRTTLDETHDVTAPQATHLEGQPPADRSPASTDDTTPTLSQPALEVAAAIAAPANATTEPEPVDPALTADLTDATTTVDALATQVQATAAAAVEAARLEAERLAAEAAEAQHRAELAAAASAHPNGQIPLDLLCDLPFAPGQRLRCDAAWDAQALNDAFAATFGYSITVSDSYRSLPAQYDTKRDRGAWAAEPGTSNHGLGVALDLATGIAQFTTPQYAWMVTNAPTYGWTHPSWADPTGSLPEPWHWEYTAPGT